MAKITDEYCRDRFFEIFARLSHSERQGIITGLRATDRVMEADAQPALPLFDQVEPEEGEE